MGVRHTRKIKRIYQKMLVAVSIEELSTVGLGQKVESGTFSPDHSMSPLILQASVKAGASDIDPNATWSVGTSAATAGDGLTAWTVDGVAVGTAWKEGTDFELQDSGKELWIYKNIDVESCPKIRVSVVVLDNRTNVSVVQESDDVELVTTAVADPSVTLTTAPNNMIYDYMADDLVEWEYRNARGLAQLMSQSEATNDSCYLKQSSLMVTKGSEGRQSSGYGMVVKDSSSNVLAKLLADGTLTISDERITALSLESITIDCRTISDEVFTLVALDSEGEEIATAQDTIHAKTIFRNIDTPEFVNTADYSVGDTKYKETARVTCNGEILEYPEAYLDIDYHVTPTGSTVEQFVGSGNSITVNPNEVGSGVTADTNGFDMAMEADFHGVYAVATDEDGATLQDEDGETLLIN